MVETLMGFDKGATYVIVVGIFIFVFWGAMRLGKWIIRKYKKKPNLVKTALSEIGKIERDFKSHKGDARKKMLDTKSELSKKIGEVIEMYNQTNTLVVNLTKNIEKQNSINRGTTNILDSIVGKFWKYHSRIEELEDNMRILLCKDKDTHDYSKYVEHKMGMYVFLCPSCHSVKTIYHTALSDKQRKVLELQNIEVPPKQKGKKK